MPARSEVIVDLTLIEVCAFVAPIPPVHDYPSNDDFLEDKRKDSV